MGVLEGRTMGVVGLTYSLAPLRRHGERARPVGGHPAGRHRAGRQARRAGSPRRRRPAPLAGERRRTRALPGQHVLRDGSPDASWRTGASTSASTPTRPSSPRRRRRSPGRSTTSPRRWRAASARWPTGSRRASSPIRPGGRDVQGAGSGLARRETCPRPRPTVWTPRGHSRLLCTTRGSRESRGPASTAARGSGRPSSRRSRKRRRTTTCRWRRSSSGWGCAGPR